MLSSCRGLALGLLVLACSSEPTTSPCALEPHGPCMGANDCADGSSCQELDWELGAGGVCTQECRDELDCVSIGSRAGRCLRLAGGVFQCFSSCDSNSQCPHGWVCQSVSTGGSVCLP